MIISVRAVAADGVVDHHVIYLRMFLFLTASSVVALVMLLLFFLIKRMRKERETDKTG